MTRATSGLAALERGGTLPMKATQGSGARDLYARLNDHGGSVVIEPGAVWRVPLGIRTEFDPDFVALVFLRSGRAVADCISLINGVGVIDSDYRGEWVACVINHGPQPVTIKHGDRIAQFMMVQSAHVQFFMVPDHTHLSRTDRGEGGFGSTGRT